MCLILSDYYSSIATRILKLKHPPALKALAKGTCEGWPNGFASRKFHAYNWLMRFYNNLCRLALGGQTVKDASKFQFDQSQRRLRKSMQVDASGWPNETQVERKSKTCVDLLVRLARTLCSGDEITAVRACNDLS